MRVLFIYTDIGTYLARHFQHGIGHLSSALRQAGHETGLLYLQAAPGEEQLLHMVDRFAPDLIALSAGTNQYPHLLNIARQIRHRGKTPIVFGGVHPTLMPEEVIADPAVQMICRGEGEDALVELAAALERDQPVDSIRNLWIRRGDRIIKNPVRPLQESLDDLPFPDREIFEHQRLLDEDRGQLSLLSGRGCPYECSYCANPALKELYRGQGRYLRRRSVSNVVAEIRSLLEKYKVKRLVFHDDIFTLDRKWVAEFAEAYRAEFALPFEVNVRVETVDREMLQALKSAGCDMIKVGVESGSDRVRRAVMHRPIAREKIVQVFRDADTLGLRTWSFNMVGLPGETAADAEDTLKLNRELDPDHMQVSVFYPYPGTALYDECREKGYLSGREVDGYFVPESVLSMPGFPEAKIYEYHRALIHLSDVCKNRKRLNREMGNRKIYYNIIDGLDSAEKEAPLPEYIAEDYFNIGEDVRRVLMAHPPSAARFRLKVPKDAELRFGVALHPGVWDKPGGDGVIFRVSIGPRAKKLIAVFEKAIDPKRVLADRRWHDQVVDLRPWSGKKIWLELRTAACDAAHTDYNTAGFSNPILVEAS